MIIELIERKGWSNLHPHPATSYWTVGFVIKETEHDLYILYHIDENFCPREAEEDIGEFTIISKSIIVSRTRLKVAQLRLARLPQNINQLERWTE